MDCEWTMNGPGEKSHCLLTGAEPGYSMKNGPTISLTSPVVITPLKLLATKSTHLPPPT